MKRGTGTRGTLIQRTCHLPLAAATRATSSPDVACKLTPRYAINFAVCRAAVNRPTAASPPAAAFQPAGFQAFGSAISLEIDPRTLQLRLIRGHAVSRAHQPRQEKIDNHVMIRRRVERDCTSVINDNTLARSIPIRHAKAALFVPCTFLSSACLAEAVFYFILASGCTPLLQSAGNR